MFSIYKVENEFVLKPNFNIHKVKIMGEFSILKKEIKELGNELYGKNIWEIDKSKIEDRLKSDFRVKEAQVLFSKLGELEIIVEEKKTAYYGDIKGKIYCIDEKGAVFTDINSAKIMELPIVYAEDEKKLKIGTTFLSSLKNEEFKKKIVQLYYIDKYKIEILREDGIVIKTSFQVLENKYEVLETLLRELGTEKKIDYVDLRFEGYIVKKAVKNVN
jgi:cell division protein FtsQ